MNELRQSLTGERSSPCRIRFTALGPLVILVTANWALGQVSPADHEKHHGGQAKSGSASAKPTTGGEHQGGHEHGDRGGSGQELYPSLMNLPELTPERRSEIQRQTHERMQAGTALMSQGLERLSTAAAANNYAGMQEGTAQMREGLAQFESGLAAQRALAEGQASRAIALQWFKSEMNLTSPSASHDGTSGPFGLSWFHSLVMTILIGFAVVMIWMYFRKMRRATELLKRLTSGIPVAGAAVSTALAVSQAGAVPPPSPASTPPTAATPAMPARAAPWPPPGTKVATWSGSLRIASIFDEAPEVKTLRLINPDGGPLPFSYVPGQFLSLTIRLDDKPVRRSYTIASSPTQRDYVEITVKRIDHGVVSSYLHEQVKAGDRLEVAAPFGSFTFTDKDGTSIVLIGGGVGITPLMTVIRFLTDRGWAGDIFLLYCCRTTRDFIFREELEYLQRRFSNLHVTVTMTRAEGTAWMGPTGRLTRELIAQSVPEIATRRIHLCGPPLMIEAVQTILGELGVPGDQVRTESFTLARGKPEPERQVLEIKPLAPAIVTFAKSAKSAPLPEDRTLLEVAETVGVEIPNVCRVGICGVCKVKLLSGSVTMAVQDALTPEDKANNLILACQAMSVAPISVEA